MLARTGQRAHAPTAVSAASAAPRRARDGKRSHQNTAAAGRHASHAESSAIAKAAATPATLPTIGRPVTVQRQPAQAAHKANAGASASAVHETPRHQNVEPAAIPIIAISTGRRGSPLASRHNPSTVTAAALATAARSRSAVRRPSAMAMAARPASADGDHGAA